MTDKPTKPTASLTIRHGAGNIQLAGGRDKQITNGDGGIVILSWSERLGKWTDGKDADPTDMEDFALRLRAALEGKTEKGTLTDD